MGNACGCKDDVDNEGEVRARNRGLKMQKQGAGKSNTNMSIGAIKGTEIMMTPELKKRIKNDGLEFEDELQFENGSVYRGYMKEGQRQGPGTQVW